MPKANKLHPQTTKGLNVKANLLNLVSDFKSDEKVFNN